MKTPAACKLDRKNQALVEHILARSPDLNPIEKYWAWLRKQLLEADLEDLRKKRDVPTKQEYKKRVLRICQTKAAKTVARNTLAGLKNVCKKVLKKKGGASGT